MKRCISLAVCLALLLGMTLPLTMRVGAMGNKNGLITALGMLEYPAQDIDLIEEGNAVMGDLDAIKTPTLDGEIGEKEYREVDLIEAAQLMGVFGNQSGWSADALAEFADVADTLIAYWGAGWDGTYLYLAFKVNTENIDFHNGLTSDNVYLFANTCFQVGVADVDATGNNYSETGYGISTQDGYEGKPVSFSWLGGYTPVSGEDFACSWDQDENLAVYEIRVNLNEALGHTVESGNQIKLAWCYMIGEGSTNMNSSHGVLYAHGITGRMSVKNATAFATVTLTGDPENVSEGTEMTEEQKADLAHGLKETVNFADPKVVDTFAPQINNASIEHMTEGEVSFARLTAKEADALIASAVYPRAVNADMIKYVAVRYRTSDAGMGELGLTYKNVQAGTGYEENGNGDYIYHDGQWRTMVLDMSSASGWNAFVSEMAFLLPKGEIDIQWVKFFTEDIFDYYDEDLPSGEVTDTETDTSTEEPTSAADTGVSTETMTDADVTGTVTTAAGSATDAAGADTGCSSALGMAGVCALLVLCGGAVAVRKKQENAD